MTLVDSNRNTQERTRLRHRCKLVLTKDKVGGEKWILIAVMARRPKQGGRSTLVSTRKPFCSQSRPILATRTSFDIARPMFLTIGGLSQLFLLQAPPRGLCRLAFALHCTKAGDQRRQQRSDSKTNMPFFFFFD